MPPGRRKVGSQGETKSHFSAGDLVLAKVKGFPAWPAKICRPEDWDRSPDPKKFFVQFFGTSEIAFVAPADIQVFSLDSKSKLVVRSRGKCAKDFGRAVEEICKAYEHLHGKISEKHNADADRSTLRDNVLDEASKSEDSEHSREVEEGGAGQLVSESPSKFSFTKDKKSPSSCPEGGKDKHIAVYFRGKMSESKLKVSTVNEKTTKFQKKYESGSKFEDAHVGKPADAVDEKRAKLYHSSASNSNTTGDNRSKVYRKSEKAPLGDSLKNVELSTNQVRDKNITAISGDYLEKKTLTGNRKRGLDASEQSHAKRTKHDDVLDVNFSGTNNQRRDKTSMDKFSVIVSTEGAEHERSSGFVKKEELLNQKKSPAPIHSRRRTFRIDDDEDDEGRRTPVHKKYDTGGFPKPNEKFYKDKMAVDKTGNRLQLTLGHSEERRPANFFRPNITSKIVGSKVKSSTDLSVKSRTVSSKHSDELHRFNHATNLKANPHTLDKMKGTQWNAAMENWANVNYSAEHSTIVDDFSSDERSAALFAESNTTESATSMRHLIAVAQAKRRETYLQGHSNDRISSLISSPAVVRERSPSPLFEMQHISDLSFIQKGKGESFSSPFTAEEHEHSVSPGILPEDVENDATEAAVARDALEGMIETLSRTRESIGRATRLAIDCAKYGIAREVVDLLVQKLENETSHHRKVDLFFLVDSVTQCSHSQKGVARESFVPSVQNALHRLLAAAVPAGSAASENRRQCLKVLRLWLERKIFPESVLRPLIDEIEFPHDGSNSALPLRRPSRAERSIDDPIRDMDGILVDEYGSNVAFNLPNFISSRVFEEEEGLPRTETPTEFATTVTYQSEDAYNDIGVSFRQQAEVPEINENPHHLYSAQRAVPSPLLPLDSPPAPPPLPLDSPPSPPPLPSSPLPPSPPLPPSSPPPPPPPPPPYPQHSSYPQSDSPTNKDYSYTPSGQTHALQQSPGLSRSVECNGRPYEFLQNSMSIEHQTGLSRQQFQSAVTSFSQGSMKSFPVPSHQVLAQYPSSATQPQHHFSRVNSMSEQHNACSLSSDSKGRVHYVAEECRRKHSGSVILESQQSSWVTGETAASGGAYDLDGLHRSNVDRPPQEFHSLHSVAPASGPHNRWRPS